MNIFVGNLSYSTEDNDLRTAFEDLGSCPNGIDSLPRKRGAIQNRIETRKLHAAVAKTSLGDGTPRLAKRMVPSGPIRYTVRRGTMPLQ